MKRPPWAPFFVWILIALSSVGSARAADPVAIPVPDSVKPPGGVAVLTEEEMLQHLDIHMTRIMNDARKERRLAAAGLAGMALIAGALGALASQSDSADLAKFGPAVGGAFGALFLGGGAYLYFTKAEAEKEIPKYRVLPQKTMLEKQNKIKEGENQLELLGIYAGRDRREKAIAFTLIGGIHIGSYIVDLGRSFHPAVLYSGVLIAGFGLYELFTRTRPEIESKEYTLWKEMRLGTLDTQKSGWRNPSWGILPVVQLDRATPHVAWASVLTWTW